MSVGTDARQRGLLLIAAAAMFVVLLAGELSHEDEALTLQDALFEILQLSLLIGCSVTSTLLALRVQAQEEEGQDLRREIELVRARNEEWRQGMSAHLRELGAAIRAQFETWRLTPAEQEVGLLLLKGFSHKEIARLRNATESTIRQQAASIYQKPTSTDARPCRRSSWRICCCPASLPGNGRCLGVSGPPPRSAPAASRRPATPAGSRPARPAPRFPGRPPG